MVFPVSEDLFDDSQAFDATDDMFHNDSKPSNQPVLLFSSISKLFTLWFLLRLAYQYLRWRIPLMLFARLSGGFNGPTFDPSRWRGIHMARTGYWLTPPTRFTFAISVALAILAVLVHYAHVKIPVVSAHVFETLLVGYLVLLIGNLFRGL